MADASWIVVFVFLSLLLLASALIWHRERKSENALDRLGSMAREAARIPAYDEDLIRFSDELSSAQRYQQPLTVGVLTLDDNPRDDIEDLADPNSQNPTVQPQLNAPLELMFPILGLLLQRSLRKNDRILAHTDQNEYIIILTHSRKAQAAQALWRIRQMSNSRVRLPLRVGLAEFPADGYTVDDLLKNARASCSQQLNSELLLSAQSTASQETRTLV